MTDRDTTTFAGGRLRIAPWLPSAASVASASEAAPAAPQPVIGAHSWSGPDAGTSPVVTAASGFDATLPAAPLLATGPVDGDGTRRWRDRWWFIVVPVVAVVALIGVAVWALPDGIEDTPTRPELSQPIAVPEQPPTSAYTGPQATTSASGPVAPSPSRSAPRPVPAPKPTIPAPAPGAPIVGLAGRCAEVAGGSSRDGTQVQLGICSGAAHQRWVVGGDGTIRTLGKCLDVAGKDTSPRTPVVLFRCDGTDTQRWRQSEDDTLRNNASGRCVDVFESFTDPGTPLILFGCHADANQRWRLG